MKNKKLTIKKKENDIVLKCPICGCTEILKPNNKVKGFPKTHLIQFTCGFAYLYNGKTEQIFSDISWNCSKAGTIQKILELNTNKKFQKDIVKKTKILLSGRELKEKNKEQIIDFKMVDNQLGIVTHKKKKSK